MAFLTFDPRHEGRARLAAYLIGLAVTYLLGVGAVELAARGDDTSPWWPAAGAAVLTMLAVPRRLMPVAAIGPVIVTAASNYVAGRPLDLSLAFGVANALEALIVALILTRGDRPLRLVSVRDVTTLLVAAFAGALGIAAGAAAAVTFLGQDAPVATFGAVFASHVSAVLSIVPLGLAWNDRTRARGRHARWLQPLVLALVIGLVFFPGTQLPLSFLPMPVLLWGAYVFPMRGVAVQLVLTATAVTTLTMFDGGPFAGAGWTPIQTSWVVQSFLVIYAGTVLYFAAARRHMVGVTEDLQVREQLLRGGFVDSQIGMLILEEDRAGEPRVRSANRHALDLLGAELTPPLEGDDPLPLTADTRGVRTLRAAIARAKDDDHGESVTEVELDGDVRVEILVTRAVHDGGRALLTVQVLDVSERVHAAQALAHALSDERTAATQLREVARQKDEFVSAVSHELRTPITSIIGFAELLEDESSLDEDAKAHLTVITRNAARLGTLVEDLLALGAGTREEPQPCDVSEAVRGVLEDLGPNASARLVTLREHVPYGIQVMIAPSDLVRVLVNLIGNAVKFTPAGGEVAVAARFDDAAVTIEIADNGPGIPPEDLERVFERFYRGRGAAEGSVPGVGLGLALVRQLVNKAGGTVALGSDGHSGTIARVTLPRVAQQAQWPGGIPTLAP
ncbi:sensor histidine kinase [Demequina zhanjiangensis]|uniref:histidine kinase n=1 Tax=Demequina zhanjiangensis TaxID=3051659 RepID=A0ABT8FXS0_9MICO|nr:ATP-binding protein [Demequina sp. SYSU T00b26]MDN4471680.1 ATP-binding protein [Demequina sp. SYSU T00b26]